MSCFHGQRSLPITCEACRPVPSRLHSPLEPQTPSRPAPSRPVIWSPGQCTTQNKAKGKYLIQKGGNITKRKENTKYRKKRSNSKREKETTMCGHQSMRRRSLLLFSYFQHIVQRRPPILLMVCKQGKQYVMHKCKHTTPFQPIYPAVTFQPATAREKKARTAPQEKSWHLNQYSQYQTLKYWVLSSITSIHIPNTEYCPV